MKKFILTLTIALITSLSGYSMSYRQARQQALFLTDKMAYELNLTPEQYEAAYEINLDYLMSIDDYSDLYGIYWRQRNIDLSYILLDWQYNAFCSASYFYRPLYWNDGYWHFSIYARYPYRNYYYFGMPRFYTVYRGGHSWRTNNGRSWYYGRRYWNNNSVGMRDGFEHGHFGSGYSGPNNRSFGRSRTSSQNFDNDIYFRGARRNGQRESSTRSTAENRDYTSPRFGGSRGTFNSSGEVNGQPSRIFSPEKSGTNNTPSKNFGGNSMPTRRFGGSSMPTRRFGGNSGMPTRGFEGRNNMPNRNFGGNNNTPIRSYGGSSEPSRSFGGSSTPSRSFQHGSFGSSK